MSNKQRLLLCYALVISIIVIMFDFGLGVRAFELAGISSTILLAALGILIAIPPIYFVLRRRLRTQR